MNVEDSAGQIIQESHEAYSWAEFASSGLLWLFNTSVLHPRGYALQIGFDDDGKCEGWCIVGDGTEPWQFSTDEETKAMIDARFAALKELLP